MMLDMDFLVTLCGVVLGFIAFGFGVTGHQHSCTKLSLYFLSASSLFWGFHFLAIGEATFIAAMINSARSLCGARLDCSKKRAGVVMICLALSVAMTIPYITNIIGYLPLIAMSLISVGVIMRDDFVKHKSLILIGEGFWLTYAIIIGSAPLAIACIFFSGAICVALWRHGQVRAA